MAIKTASKVGEFLHGPFVDCRTGCLWGIVARWQHPEASAVLDDALHITLMHLHGHQNGPRER